MSSPLRILGSKRAVANSVASAQNTLVAPGLAPTKSTERKSVFGKLRTSFRKSPTTGKEDDAKGQCTTNAPEKMEVRNSLKHTAPSGSDLGTTKEKRGKRVRRIRKKVKKSTALLLAEKEAEIQGMEARLEELLKLRESQAKQCDASTEESNVDDKQIGGSTDKKASLKSASKDNSEANSNTAVGTAKAKRVRRRKIARKKMKEAIARKEQEDLLAEKEADIKGMEARLAELMLQHKNQ